MLIDFYINFSLQTFYSLALNDYVDEFYLAFGNPSVLNVKIIAIKAKYFRAFNGGGRLHSMHSRLCNKLNVEVCSGLQSSAPMLSNLKFQFWS